MTDRSNFIPQWNPPARGSASRRLKILCSHLLALFQRISSISLKPLSKIIEFILGKSHAL